ncbi:MULTISPECIES: DUF6153 family protein [unclassified Streptomyces]|uniref:DUF6153 family protein n=1 Tax=unclassified Streptomyces TaxID=2593676 RepID=UPI0027E4741A|nr:MULTISPECIES: DUF6153 family protein [unclassified Streptomyces]
MTVGEPRTPPRPQPVLWLRLLLVPGLTLGLLVLHALGTAAALPSSGATEHMSHHVAAAQAGPQCLCPDDAPGPTRHGGHADQRCASTALPGSPGIADTPAALPLALDYEPAGGRAPPMLTELQILRI